MLDGEVNAIGLGEVATPPTGRVEGDPIVTEDFVILGGGEKLVATEEHEVGCQREDVERLSNSYASGGVGFGLQLRALHLTDRSGIAGESVDVAEQLPQELCKELLFSTKGHLRVLLISIVA